MKQMYFFLCSLLLAASCTLCSFLPAYAGDAEEVLQLAAKRTEHIRSIYASFTQEKKLSILEDPLRSSGFLCMQRSDTPDTLDTVSWVYEKPAPSGFGFAGAEAWLWVDSPQARRPAKGAEATGLRIASEHMLAWMYVRPEALARLYTMERLPDQEDCPVLRLKPLKNASYFTTMEVMFAPSLDTVRQLRFVEKNGDSTRLEFYNTQINAPLPLQCNLP